MIEMNSDEQAIEEIVKLYFTGTYQGNIEALKKAFHPNAHIVGSLKGQIYDWKLDEFIARVTDSPTAVEKGEKYDKQILLLEKTGDIAIVKAQVVVGDLVFTDYISLLKYNGTWVIRNKCFTV